MKDIVKVGKKYYDLTDKCLYCDHAFECTTEGKTYISAYVQMGTLNLRECPNCCKVQEWKLKEGKQGFNHKVDHEYSNLNS